MLSEEELWMRLFQRPRLRSNHQRLALIGLRAYGVWGTQGLEIKHEARIAATQPVEKEFARLELARSHGDLLDGKIER